MNNKEKGSVFIIIDAYNYNVDKTNKAMPKSNPYSLKNMHSSFSFSLFD